MTISLDPQLVAVLRQKVDDGLYRTTDEALNEAVRLLDERDRRLQALRSLLAVGLAQAERGELIDLTPELLDEIGQEANERFERDEYPNSRLTRRDRSPRQRGE